METLEPLLKSHPFFRDLDESSLQLLAGCAINRVYHPGSYIFRSGEEANEFYLLRSGLVDVEIEANGQQPIVLQTVGEGEILGWSWLLPPYFWHFDARVQEEVRVLVLDGRCIRNKCENNHTLGFEMLKRFSKIMESRLESTRLQLLDVYKAA